MDLIYKMETGRESLVTRAASLAAGESLTLENNTVMGNKQLTFSCRFDKFGAVRAGHGYTEFSAAYFELDRTHLRVYSRTRETKLEREEAHGLDIGVQLNVTVSVKYGTADITLASRGGVYAMKNVPWDGRRGTIYAAVTEGSLSDAVLRWSCGDYKKRIYAFGDSYFNPTSPLRWTSYMLADGYRNALLCGYPGMGAPAGLTEFRQALKHGTPKFAFWCMGMNNRDREDGPNVQWKRATDSFLAICRDKGIIPVLSTIPPVPPRINSFKNEYVRSSGCRYVDFEKAVTIPGTSNWYEGMLAEDQVHPLAPGARALYAQAMTDFPELFF